MRATQIHEGIDGNICEWSLTVYLPVWDFEVMARSRFEYRRNGKAVNVERLSIDTRDWLEIWELSICTAFARASGRLFLQCGHRHRVCNGVGVFGWAHWGNESHAILGDAAHWTRWLEQFQKEADHAAACRSSSLPSIFTPWKGDAMPRIRALFEVAAARQRLQRAR